MLKDQQKASVGGGTMRWGGQWECTRRDVGKEKSDTGSLGREREKQEKPLTFEPACLGDGESM